MINSFSQLTPLQWEKLSELCTEKHMTVIEVYRTPIKDSHGPKRIEGGWLRVILRKESGVVQRRYWNESHWMIS